MKRFFGVMAPEDIKIMRSFRDDSGLILTIEAGPRGWTIIWADHSVDYRDIDDTSENNFRKAYETAMDCVGPLRQLER